MNNINEISNPFTFSEKEVRTAIGEDGEVWFCAKDVFEALGITWSQRSGSLKNYPENWVCPLYLKGQSGTSEVIFISEPAVYKAIFASRKPEAEAFANWVCSEVLPTIRKQGYFGKVSGTQRLAYSKQITAIIGKLTTSKDALAHQFLTGELRDLCNLIGRPAPDLTLLGKDYQQLGLEV